MSRRRGVAWTLIAVVCLTSMAVGEATASDLTKDFHSGKPPIQSMSSLEFGPDGILFVGDSMGGAVFAIETGDVTEGDGAERFAIDDVESKIAALLGTTADEVLIHDLAVNPISKKIYVSVSRGRSGWTSRWQVPNDLEDAKVILTIDDAGEFGEFSLGDVRYSMAELPDPIDASKEHPWKKETSMRVDAVTDLVYDDGTVYVAGLCNEEFASAMWQVPFPFGSDPTFSTLSVFHGAHGEWETHAPVRTFLPYDYDGSKMILAAFLCTPLVTFRLDDLQDGQHVTGKTVAEFGSGNYPLDMVRTRFGDKEFVVMANSMLPLMTFDPAEAASWEDGIVEEPSTYTAGMGYVPRSGSGIQQLDSYNNSFLIAMQRMPNGKMNLVSLSLEWLAY